MKAVICLCCFALANGQVELPLDVRIQGQQSVLYATDRSTVLSGPNIGDNSLDNHAHLDTFDDLDALDGLDDLNDFHDGKHFGKGCKGSADPKPGCYAGKFGFFLKEHVAVKVDSYSSPKGTMELTGGGRIPIFCKVPFTKAGQNIITDLSRCLPSPRLTVPTIKYCSKKDRVYVLLRIERKGHKFWGAWLKRTSCGSGSVAV